MDFSHPTVSKGPFFSSILLSTETFSSESSGSDPKKALFACCELQHCSFLFAAVQAQLPNTICCSVPGNTQREQDTHRTHPQLPPCSFWAPEAVRASPGCCWGLSHKEEVSSLALSFLLTLFTSVQPLGPVPPSDFINLICSFRQLFLLELHPP